MCAENAKTATSDEQRERLFKMEQAMLALAENQDGLDGRATSRPDEDRLQKDDL